jgi:integrase
MRHLTTPKSLLALIGPNPRVIADDVWAKLVWAGLNLAAEDLPRRGPSVRSRYRPTSYPIELCRALALTWLFAGLRSNEIVRLRLGCIRWQRDDATVPGTGEVLPVSTRDGLNSTRSRNPITSFWVRSPSRSPTAY